MFEVGDKVKDIGPHAVYVNILNEVGEILEVYNVTHWQSGFDHKGYKVKYPSKNFTISYDNYVGKLEKV